MKSYMKVVNYKVTTISIKSKATFKVVNKCNIHTKAYLFFLA